MIAKLNPFHAVWIAAAFLVGAPAVAQEMTPEVTQLDTVAEQGDSVPLGRIAAEFGEFLGEDAETVVHGLRNGESIVLEHTAPTPDPTGEPTPGAMPGDVPQTTTVTIETPTGKMGNGNVTMTLALAQDELERSGISTPDAHQLQAALTGGSVTNAEGMTSDLAGVLTLRADGMGWGQIARANGTTPGAVMSRVKSNGMAGGPPSRGPAVTRGLVADMPPSAFPAVPGAPGANGHGAGLGHGRWDTAGVPGSRGNGHGNAASASAGAVGNGIGGSNSLVTRGGGRTGSPGNSGFGQGQGNGFGNGPGNGNGLANGHNK